MRADRGWTLSVLVLTATPWAAVLSFAGLVLLLAPALLPGPLQELSGSVRVLIGLLGLASGQLVFSCLVADRLFPSASRPVVWASEIATCVVLFAAFSLLVWLVTRVYFGAAG
ncbi:MAG: hypothetical protein EA378_07650 [Phycisphaerales bacterium]|nr:MAG: hypothetical protein EA378_07650 [Phycisphaerales bacterium]